jgi:hypothetical protein
MKTNTMLAEFNEGEKACARNLAQKLAFAKNELAAIKLIERSLESSRDEMLARAWKLGEILSELKEEIGHGKWLFWLGGNWPELGERNARRCIALFKDNQGWSGKMQNSAELAVDSVRKFMWGYIPAKERLALDGDEEIKPGLHHLTFVNQFSKYDRQLRSGHVESFELETFKREVEPMIRRIVELTGRDWIYSILPPPC